VKLENFTVFQDQRRVSASPQEKIKEENVEKKDKVSYIQHAKYLQAVVFIAFGELPTRISDFSSIL
jgi:hypothetical protein